MTAVSCRRETDHQKFCLPLKGQARRHPRPPNINMTARRTAYDGPDRSLPDYATVVEKQGSFGECMGLTM